jgi:uncharacterized protein (TIGR00725 family)
MAEAIGELLAQAGQAVVCGGRDGVMAAVCRGAKQAGGVTIGILPGYDPAEANPWVDHAIPTGMGHARNAIVVASGDAVIAVGGGFGTLSEIGLALKMGKRVVALGSWDLEAARLRRFQADGGEFLIAESAEVAVQLALENQQPHDRRPEFQPSGHG